MSDEPKSGSAIILSTHWARAKELAGYARSQDCNCRRKRRNRRIVNCVSCLAVLIGHAMTEASTTPEQREQIRTANKTAIKADDVDDRFDDGGDDTN